ncbi:AB hydrolase-1 domain-containing protein [Mycena sanguinolenta]|uniref:AB hydrolase-1 domain-containing protein n=1 Tax=Mycena sanguinolenta TaxID=230812 RepID=A0A8H7DIS9_9AGAR|nr:AB hydrolase-1 domain-containing protein [Mycena sanguinolenta]
MPDILLNTPTGPVEFNYVISTPTQTSAPCIDPALPTVLFLHPVYLGKIIYHLQFADPNLRRFNLVALDFRCHAQTTGKAGKGYGREVAARDVALFMSTLQIPQYHLFGMSMGGCIALQTGILFPSSVLSIFVVSSLPLTEPPDVGEGRQEIYDYWAEGARCGETVEAGSMMSEAIQGCLQLSVNSQPTPIFNAILRASTPFMASQWGVNSLDDFHSVSVDFFTQREAYTVDAIRNIKCPVRLVHCGADIAYDLSTTNQVADHLRTAGVPVDVIQIPGAPHFGATTHPKEVNAVFHEFLLSVCSDLPPIPQHVKSPFTEQLVEVGWDTDSDDEEDHFFI